MRDYYAILGVDRDADANGIKAAFRRLAKDYHPDRNPGDDWAERLFKEINEAYETLSDEKRRASYDEALAMGELGFADESSVDGDWTGERAAVPLGGDGANIPGQGPEPEPGALPQAHGHAHASARPPWGILANAFLGAGGLVLLGGLVFWMAAVHDPQNGSREKVLNEPLPVTALQDTVPQQSPPQTEQALREGPQQTAGPLAEAAKASSAAGSPADAGLPADTGPPEEEAAASGTAAFGEGEEEAAEPPEPAQQIQELAVTQGPSPAAAAWNSLRETRDAAALGRFVLKFPATPEAREAETLAASLVEAEKREKVLAALASEFQALPMGRLAQTRLENLRAKAAEAEAAAEAAWASLSSGTPQGFMAFLEAHGTNRHAGEARARLEDMGYTEVRAGAAAKAQKRWLKAMDTFRDCGDCPLMAVVRARRIPAAEGQETALAAALPGPFAAGKFPLSVREWNACVQEGGCTASPALAGRPGGEPATGLSWNDGQAYTRWLRKRTGHRYRLLTEREWRYAVRLRLVAPGGADPARRVQDGFPGPPAVGPMAWGPFGRSGREWVSDCWADAGQGLFQRGGALAGPGRTPCVERVLLARGGGRFERYADGPGRRQRDYTFRVARSLD